MNLLRRLRTARIGYRGALSAGAAVVVITMTVWPGVAKATTTGPTHLAGPNASRQAVVRHAVSVSAAHRAALRRYWTPSRMKNAIPLDLSGRAASSHHPGLTRPSGTPAATPLTRPQRPHSSGVRPHALTVSDAQGKVYFHNPGDGKDYVCSAGTVNSPKGDMVFTAGHCVYDPGYGTWMEDWIYVPAYYQGSMPFGIWDANYLTTFNGWKNEGLFDYDVGVVNVDGDLVSQTGGNGLEYDANDCHCYTPDVTVWGYPAAPPYDGETPYYCYDIPTYIVSPLDLRLATGCAMTQGASGGPWLEGYDTSDGLGDEDALTSTNVPGYPGYIASPYFGSDIATIYNNTKNL